MGQSCSSCHLSYCPLKAFILWGCSFWFVWSWCVIYHLGLESEIQQARLPFKPIALWPSPFLSAMMQCMCLIFLLSNMCIWVKNVFVFFSASVNILSTEEAHFLLEMWNVVSRLQFFGFSFVFQCCFVKSTVNYTGLYHPFPQRHPPSPKKKRQAEWKKISMWMTLHIL